MSLIFEELDFRQTPLGDLMLRRRRMPQLGDLDIYEVKLQEHYLMSSLFHEAEHQLAKIALNMLDKDTLDVVVGGLGLGYTAVSALEDQRVSSLVVIEYLVAVIEWHRMGLVPQGKTLMSDPRCELVQQDFFELSRDTGNSFTPDQPTTRYDAILLDIDHAPDNVLHQSNTRFYTRTGLLELSEHLLPGGVFALWADGAPDPYFTRHLRRIFASADDHLIEFDNPVTGGTSCGSVYVARTQS